MDDSNIDSVSGANAENPAPTQPKLADLETVWLEKLEAAQWQSLAHPDPFIACLGKASCDLLGAGLRWQKKVDALLADTSISLKRCERVRPLEDTVTKIVRQAAQLVRITEQNQRGKPLPR